LSKIVRNSKDREKKEKKTKKAVFGEIIHAHIAEYYRRRREEGEIGEKIE